MPGVRFLVLLLALGCGASACSSDEPTASTEEPIGEGTGKPDAQTPAQDGGETQVLGPAVECAVGGAVEIEGNDTPETANAFTELTFCGVLATGKDVDYATFDTPPGTKLSVFQGVIDGKVDFELSLAGAKFGPGETSKFGSGTYLVKAFTKAGKSASYSYRVQFDPK
ncbi:hypothetical protein BH11MYX4_BH11MYX4_21330 [soil metagenome]